MQPIEKVYPNFSSWVADYRPLIESFGYPVVVWVDEEDTYEGDTGVLFRDSDARYGFLVFGWGSCSGCDALQMCRTLAEVDQLRNELADKIRWGTPDELLAWMREKDWSVEFFGRKAWAHRFVSECTQLLEKVASNNQIVLSTEETNYA